MSKHVIDSIRHCLDNIVATCFLSYELTNGLNFRTRTV